MKLEITIGNHHFVLIMILLSFLAITGYALAYGSSNPPVMGHSIQELDWSSPVPGNLYVENRLGIGKTSAGYPLDIEGSGMRIERPGSAPKIVLTSGYTDHYGYIEWKNGDAANTRGGYLGYGVPGNYIGFALENGNDLAIYGGDVGIGTTSPSSTLEVAGNLETSRLYDRDGSNFFDGGCGNNQHITSISSTGAISCANNPAPPSQTLSCTTRSVSGTGNYQNPVTANCQAGELITGGGCRSDHSGWGTGWHSNYISGNGYRCYAAYVGPPFIAYTAFARCCRLV